MYILPSNALAHPSKLVIVTLFSIVALFGVMFFWYEDLIYLERRRIGRLVNMYNLEEKYKWLPNFIHTTLVYRKKFDSSNQKSILYITTGSMILVGTGAALFFLASIYIGNYAYFLSLSIVIFITAYCLFLRKSSKRFEEIFNGVKNV